MVLLAGGIIKGGSRVSELNQNHWAGLMGWEGRREKV